MRVECEAHGCELLGEVVERQRALPGLGDELRPAPAFGPTLTLSKARSRLDRRRFSRPDTHFSAFLEIYSRAYRAKKKCTHFSSPEKKYIWRRAAARAR